MFKTHDLTISPNALYNKVILINRNVTIYFNFVDLICADILMTEPEFLIF